MMVTVNVRELLHNFSHYLEQIQSGERVIVLHRKTPVADIVPHNENMTQPAWKRKIQKHTIKGISLSQATSKYRNEER